jgi:nucleotide-binding universal stress UspA family protein
MALRDILVHVDSSESGRMRLRLAIDLATRHDARLTALHIREYSIAQQRRLKASELGLVPGKKTDRLIHLIKGEIDASIDDLHKLLQQLEQDRAVHAKWVGIEGQAHKLVPQYSRYADLTIVGHDSSENADLPDEYSFAETMIFTAGRPLLIIPSEAATAVEPQLGQHIAIAWNGSRASARALSDALPLLEQAERTSVLLVDPHPRGHPNSLPTAAILEHIGRHTANPHLQSLQATDLSIADMLQSTALSLGADLLVAGAHGRPGLWEKMLGGVTRDLLARMRLPLLMSY